MKNWIKLKVLCIAISAAILLASCGDSGSDASSDAPAPSGAAQSSETSGAPGGTPEEPAENKETIDFNALLNALPANPSPGLGSFSTLSIDGETVTQDILKEHNLTMVNIWATFCGPCITEMPDLGALSREYADQGFQVIGILADVQAQDGSIAAGQVETAREIIAKTQADYLHLLPSNDLYTAWLNQVTAVPETIFLDKDGNQVGEVYLGAKDKKQWSQIIDELLKEVR